MDPFHRTWVALALLGKVDAPGGWEYRRVRGAWVRAGRPFLATHDRARLANYIVEHANMPPPGRHD